MATTELAEAVQPFMEDAALLVPFLFILLIMAFVLGILAFGLWLYMLIDCSKRKKFRHGDRVLWILLLVLTGGLGMILYYFMEMRK